MNEIKISSFVEYLSYVEKNYSRDYIFRGLNNLDYLLVPKIGRKAYVAKCNPDFVVDELQKL